jgi:hypothetical protein
VVSTAQATTAKPARNHGFNSDPVTHLDTPSTRGFVSNFCDLSQWFMAWDDWHRDLNRAFILLEVTATNTASFKL